VQPIELRYDVCSVLSTVWLIQPESAPPTTPIKLLAGVPSQACDAATRTGQPCACIAWRSSWCTAPGQRGPSCCCQQHESGCRGARPTPGNGLLLFSHPPRCAADNGKRPAAIITAIPRHSRRASRHRAAVCAVGCGLVGVCRGHVGTLQHRPQAPWQCEAAVALEPPAHRSTTVQSCKRVCRPPTPDLTPLGG
jgi:hypothetical protein